MSCLWLGTTPQIYDKTKIISNHVSGVTGNGYTRALTTCCCQIHRGVKIPHRGVNILQLDTTGKFYKLLRSCHDPNRENHLQNELTVDLTTYWILTHIWQNSNGLPGGESTTELFTNRKKTTTIWQNLKSLLGLPIVTWRICFDEKKTKNFTKHCV